MKFTVSQQIYLAALVQLKAEQVLARWPKAA